MAIKSLATLIQLQKTLVDEQRVLLARLQDDLDRIEHKLAAFKVQMVREAEAARAYEASGSYGAFVKQMLVVEKALEKEKRTATTAVKIAQGRLASLFEEQKRYEIAEERRIEAEAKEELRRENLELDEIGGVMHERHKEK